MCLEGRRGVFTGWDCDPIFTIKQFILLLNLEEN